MAFGIPAWLAKLTLISQCTRLTYIIGVLDIFCLIRALALSERCMKPYVAIVLTLLCAGLNIWMANHAYLGANQWIGYLFCGVNALLLFYLVFTYHQRAHRSLFLFLLTIVMLTCGGFVNPIEKGTQMLEDVEPLQAIQAVDAAEDASWISLSNRNLPLLAGKRTPFSTHEYPDLDFWRFFDPDGSQEDQYNSFIHIECVLSDQPSAIFSDKQIAFIRVNINYQDLSALGIDYIVTPWEDNSGWLMEVAKSGHWRVYQVQSSL